MTKKIIIFVFIIVYSSICFGESYKNLFLTNSPVALIVLTSSSQMDEEKDLVQRKFIIETATLCLTSLFKDNIKIESLNNDIDYDTVFKKDSPKSFFFDEIEMAKIARSKGYTSILIVYYAYLPDPAGFIIQKEGLKIHRLCQIYSYLFDANEAKIIYKTNSLETFSELINKKSDKEIKNMYRNYYIDMTKKMFLSEN